ncbi:DUF892 family protein (plasmid) [Ensifer adhaerens]|nr:DUF892 family protein [Ensifer adhaerens]UAY05782.1 DUF892 family protein [Ensifer adhaerens]UAY13160.1 DUF892 family protein [Ensifer adhaerens]
MFQSSSWPKRRFRERWSPACRRDAVVRPPSRSARADPARRGWSFLRRSRIACRGTRLERRSFRSTYLFVGKAGHRPARHEAGSRASHEDRAIGNSRRACGFSGIERRAGREQSDKKKAPDRNGEIQGPLSGFSKTQTNYYLWRSCKEFQDAASGQKYSISGDQSGKAAFDKHLQETELQVDRLVLLDNPACGKPVARWAAALSKRVRKWCRNSKTRPHGCGAFRRCAAVGHCEIARYGTVRSWALQLRKRDVANLLEQPLVEEEKIDSSLTQFAEAKSTNKRTQPDFLRRGMVRRIPTETKRAKFSG